MDTTAASGTGQVLGTASKRKGNRIDLPAKQSTTKANGEDGTEADLETRKLDAIRKVSKRDDVRSTHRRVWRTLVFFVFAGLFYGLWCAFTLGNQPVKVSKRYDPTQRLSIQVSACNIALEPGDDATLQVEALAGSFQRTEGASTSIWSHSPSDVNVVVGAVIGNVNGCAHMPGWDCGRLCQVTVTVPSDAQGFLITQPFDDTNSFPQLEVREGCRFKELRVHSPSIYSAAPSLELRTTGAAIDSVFMRLGDGNAWILDTEVRSLDIRGAASGSVYVLDHPAANTDVTTYYRQPSHRFCLATDVARPQSNVVVAPPKAGPNCNFDDLLDGTGTSNYVTYSDTIAHFDKDSSGRISKAEFLNGMYAFTCCGGGAPHECWCEEHAYIVFPPVDAIFYDRFDLTVANFLESLVANNYTELLGKPGSGNGGCYASVDATVTGATSSASMKLRSDGGEVVVTLKQATEQAGAVDYNESMYSPPNKLSGMRMVTADAKRLMATYGATYGDRNSSGEIFLVIDGYSLLGRTRWVYATNPAYFVLDPALLTAIGGFAVRPKVVHDRVTFMSNDCAFGASDVSLRAEQRNLTLNQMYEQLSKALVSSAADIRGLRGQLVLQNYERLARDAPEGASDVEQLASGGGEIVGTKASDIHLTLDVFAPTTPDHQDGLVRERWSDEFLTDTLYSAGLSPKIELGPLAQATAALLTSRARSSARAVILSLVFGAGLGLIAFLALSEYLRRVLKARKRRLETNRIMTLLHHFPDLSIQELRDQEHARGQDDDLADAWNPFEMPLVLLNQLFVDPIERGFVNSVDRFLAESVTNARGHALTKSNARDGLLEIGGGIGGAVAREVTQELDKVLHEAKSLVENSVKMATSAHRSAGSTLKATFAPDAGGPIRAAPQLAPGDTADAADAANADATPSSSPVNTASRAETRRSAAQPFLYLRSFFRQYELFCLENDLPIEPNRAKVQRRLIQKFNLRIKQLEVSRLRGVRWTEATLDEFELEGGLDEHLSKKKLKQERQATRKRTAGGSADVLDPSGVNAQVDSRSVLVDKPLKELPKNWVKLVLDQTAVVTRLPADFIDLKTGRVPVTTRYGGGFGKAAKAQPTGTIRPGLIHIARKWCHKHGYKPPDLNRAEQWTTHLPAGVAFRDRIKVRQVYGLRWRQQPQNDDLLGTLGLRGFCRIPPSWYFIEALAVFVHMVFFFGSALLLILLGASVTDTWATSFAPLQHQEMARGKLVLWHDIVQPVPFSEISGYTGFRHEPLFNWAGKMHMLAAVIFSGCATVRLLLNYTRPTTCLQRNLANCIRETIVNTFAFLLMLYLLYWASLLCTAAAWVMLASVMFPTTLLPVGTAVVTLMVTISSVSSYLSAQFRDVLARVRKSLLKVLSHKLDAARRQIELAAAERLAKQNAVEATDDPEGFDKPLGPSLYGAGVGDDDKQNQEEVSARDIFALLLRAHDAEHLGEDDDHDDDDADPAIEKDDFKRLIQALDLNLTEMQLDRLFSMIDLDGTGKVTADEFESAWDSITDELIAESMRELGVSKTNMGVTIAGVIVLIAILFAFIFLALSGWSGNTTFDAVVQSSLIALCGRAASSTTRVKNSTEIDDEIKTVLGQQEEAANDD